MATYKIYFTEDSPYDNESKILRSIERVEVRQDGLSFIDFLSNEFWFSLQHISSFETVTE